MHPLHQLGLGEIAECNNTAYEIVPSRPDRRLLGRIPAYLLLRVPRLRSSELRPYPILRHWPDVSRLCLSKLTQAA
jgi:hypothetical protein